MGVNVLIYQKKRSTPLIIELKESVHYWLFNQANLEPLMYKKLYWLKDYYKTDVEYRDESLMDLIVELELLVGTTENRELENILYYIKQNDVEKVRVSGD